MADCTTCVAGASHGARNLWDRKHACECGHDALQCGADLAGKGRQGVLSCFACLAMYDMQTNEAFSSLKLFPTLHIAYSLTLFGGHTLVVGFLHPRSLTKPLAKQGAIAATNHDNGLHLLLQSNDLYFLSASSGFLRVLPSVSLLAFHNLNSTAYICGDGLLLSSSLSVLRFSHLM
jgi:hypothetical protein